MANRVLFTGLFLMVAACGGGDDSSGTGGDSTLQNSPQPSPSSSGTVTTPAPGGTSTTPPATDPENDPGTAPAAGCKPTTDSKTGLFTRTTSGGGSYVGYVPKGYAGAPTMLVVGIHGCGDTAVNFAQWAVNPYATIDKQTYIGISIGGRDGACWDTANDDAKVTAAIEDVKSCFYIHQHKVVLAGYSSGGILAYKMGLTGASDYAGIIIENSGLEGTDPAKAAWKINVAHIAHQDDQDFPIAQTMADWAKLKAAGIPLQSSVVAGTHDGTSDDWANFLVPKITGWISP